MGGSFSITQRIGMLSKSVIVLRVGGIRLEFFSNREAASEGDDPRTVDGTLLAGLGFLQMTQPRVRMMTLSLLMEHSFPIEEYYIRVSRA